MRYLTLLPLLALLACSESTTAPTETPDPFWSGTKPAVRVTVLDGTKEAPATDRVGRVRIDVLWDSTWTPGATDRRAYISGPTDSVMRYATIGRHYFNPDTLSSTNRIVASSFDVPVVRTLSFEQDVYCPGKVPQISVGAALLRGSPDAYVVQTSGIVYCAAAK